MFYVFVVCFRIPLSLRTRGEIDLEVAKREHEAYVKYVLFFFAIIYVYIPNKL